LSGADFDHAWVASQITAHQEALAGGKQELVDGSSNEVKELARNAGPIVQEHLNMLQNIKSPT